MGVRFKLILPLVFLILAFTALVQFYWLPRYLSERAVDILEQERVSLEILGTGLVEPILSGDLARLHAEIDATLRRKPQWSSLVLTDGRGKRIYPLQDSALEANSDTELVTLAIHHLDAPIGYLRLRVNTAPLVLGEVERIRTLLVLLLGSLVVITVVIAFLQDRLVRRPLKLLARTAARMANGDYEGRLPPHDSNDEVGRLVSAFGVMRDNIRHYQQEQEQDAAELRDSEERFRAVVNNVADGIVIFDQGGIIEAVNPAVTRLTGYQRRELIGEHVGRLLPNSGFEALLVTPDEEDAELWPEAPVTNVREVTINCNDGKQARVELVISDMWLHRRRLFIGVLRDIGERKKLEQQLRHAQKMKAIGQMTGGIAHDFNNILASILGYTELANERYAEKDARLGEYLAQIRGSGERATELVTQMLAFSRGGESKARPVDVRPLVEDAIKMLRATMPTTIVITTNFDATAPYVMLDPVKLQQVIVNLCVNARDAMEGRGYMGIRVKRRLTVPGISEHCASCQDRVFGNFVELEVSDSGKGISTENLEQIFDPFFTTKEVGEGTGMGLSMVHGIVHECSGHILLETDPHTGTIFRILFPTIERETRDTPHQEPVLSPLGSDSGRGHILLVDDESTIVKFMTELLQSRGYRVTSLTDSREALQVFRRDPQDIDLLITDETMSYITGSELSREVLTLRPDLPIILCSGYSDQIDDHKAAHIGIRCFMMKPVTTNALLGALRELMPKLH